MLTRKSLTSPAATRAAFIVIVVFVLAQMGWWIYFQQRYVAEVTGDSVASLQREAHALSALLKQGARAEVEALLTASPHLRLDANAAEVEVDAGSYAEFTAKQRATVRMFAFEGPFFALVIIGGLFIIGRSLRLERELKRRQSNFLDAMGHEFKTPISTLRLLLETLQLRTLPAAKQQEYLQRMTVEVNRLEKTEQQVLAAARMEAGSDEHQPGLHDLSSLVHTVVSRARSGLEARGAELVVELSCENLPVIADLEDVSILVGNLLDNAVKYSPDVKKFVAVRLFRQGSAAKLVVEDRGRGIPAHERQRVLERFYRIGNELTRSTSGLGLGLHLVHGTATARGGEVRIEGVRGGGTRVVVSLPLQELSEQQPTLRLKAAD
jgi:signal transduction histidine kinase